MMHRSPPPLRATYRVQVHAKFTLHDVRAIVPYLARLGISHLYTSPILRSEEGSTHGYDVLAHDAIDDEAGGRAALDALAALGLAPREDTTPELLREQLNDLYRFELRRLRDLGHIVLHGHAGARRRHGHDPLV